MLFTLYLCILLYALLLIFVGLPAHQLDIQVGDMITEVDGTDVTRANGEMVASMIKYVFSCH